MGMNFPDLPTIGEVFGPYEWDGEKWVTTSTGGGDGGGGGIDQTTADARYVNVTGDVMSGFLSLHADPTDVVHAVTKRYVDALIAGVGGGGDMSGYLPLTGGTLSGDLIMTELGTQIQLMHDGNQLNTTLHFGTPGTGIFGDVNAVRIAAGAMHVANFLKDRVDFMFPVSLPTADPTEANHATTKSYVDAQIAAGSGDGEDFLPLAGGTITGALRSIFAGTATNPNFAFGAAGDGLYGATGWMTVSIDGAPRFSVNSAAISTFVPIMLPLDDPTMQEHATTKKYVDAQIAAIEPPALPPPPPMAIAFPFSGKPVMNTIVNVAVAIPVTLAANFAGSVAHAEVAPSYSPVFLVYAIQAGVKTQCGAVTFNADGTVTIAGSDLGVALAVGDVLQVVGPMGMTDATLSDICITFLAERA
jgi:hypothetical protein